MANNNKSGTFWNRLTRHFWSTLSIGIITLVPFAATVWIIYWIFTKIDSILQPFIREFLGMTIPGLGFAITVVLILLVGYVASNVIGRTIIHNVEKVIPGMPVVHQLYTSIKQIMESFSASKGASRMPPVIIDFPQKGMKALGFITKELQNPDGRKLFVVFVPSVPTPAGGFMQVVEESQIIRTNISIEAAIKMVVSAGRIVPDEIAEALFANSQQSKS